MENLELYKITSLNIKTQFKGDLLYHEGTVLSHFIDIENPDKHYFYKWCDCDTYHNRWKIFEISKEDLLLFFEKKITLLQLIQKNNFVYFVDLDSDLERKSTFICPTQRIPKDYSPSENSFFDEMQYEMYASVLKDNLQKQKEYENESKEFDLKILNKYKLSKQKKFFIGETSINIEFLSEIDKIYLSPSQHSQILIITENSNPDDFTSGYFMKLKDKLIKHL